VAHLLAGLDTTEIGCCGTTDSAYFHHGISGRRRCTAADRRLAVERRPRRASADSRRLSRRCTRLGCNSCYCEPSIRSFAVDLNTWRCHLRPHFHPAYSRASYCCIHHDPGSLLGPCRTPSGCFGISESIELTFYNRSKHTTIRYPSPQTSISPLFLSISILFSVSQNIAFLAQDAYREVV